MARKLLGPRRTDLEMPELAKAIIVLLFALMIGGALILSLTTTYH